MMFFDPIYVFLPFPAITTCLWAWTFQRRTFRQTSPFLIPNGLTGASCARELLSSRDRLDIQVASIDKPLSDLFDPTADVLRLSNENYEGRSLATLAIVAREIAIPLGEPRKVPWAEARAHFASIALYGSSLFWLVLASSLALDNVPFFLAAIAIFTANVALQLGFILIDSWMSRSRIEELAGAIALEEQDRRRFREAVFASRLSQLLFTLTGPYVVIFGPIRQRLLR